MAVSLTCRHCNVEIVAADEDELVERVRTHVQTHEGGGPELTREHILGRLHRHENRPD